MIIGIGTDIVKSARFEGVSQHFMARVFTPRERAYLLSKPSTSVAGVFAAKEAVAKALGTGFSGFWPNQIEITHDKSGKPHVVLHGEAACIASRLASGDRHLDHTYSIMLSISHTSTDAVAFAIIVT